MRASGILTILWIASTAALAPALALAGSADKVYKPVIEYGEFEVELRGGYLHDSDPAVNTTQQYVLDLGYGVTPWWFSEFVTKFTNNPDASARIDAFELENIFQLTEQGKYWMDVGFFTEYAHPKTKGDPDAFEFGPLFEKEIGATINTLDLLAERQLGAGRERKTHGEYRFQSQWRSGGLLDFGVQAFGELTGEEKSQMLGPALFGQFRLGKDKVKFDAGLPIGLTRDSPDLLFRWQVEFEFR